jgi:hypothetical protein
LLASGCAGPVWGGEPTFAESWGKESLRRAVRVLVAPCSRWQGIEMLVN